MTWSLSLWSLPIGCPRVSARLTYAVFPSGFGGDGGVFRCHQGLSSSSCASSAAALACSSLVAGVVVVGAGLCLGVGCVRCCWSRSSSGMCGSVLMV